MWKPYPEVTPKHFFEYLVTVYTPAAEFMLLAHFLPDKGWVVARPDLFCFNPINPEWRVAYFVELPQFPPYDSSKKPTQGEDIGKDKGTEGENGK